MDDYSDKTRVKIGSMSYQITSAEDSSYIREIARQADEMIRNLMKGNPRLNSSQATVLALMNAVDACDRIKQSDVQTKESKADLLRALEESKAERLRLREQCWEMKKDLLYYRNLCELYEERVAELPKRGKSSKAKSQTASEASRPLDRMQRAFEETQPSRSNTAHEPDDLATEVKRA